MQGRVGLRYSELGRAVRCCRVSFLVEAIAWREALTLYDA
jgi:hypothetical protein